MQLLVTSYAINNSILNQNPDSEMEYRESTLKY